ncbi:DnaJ domain-containing protein [Mucidula mucida]|nr:DnaJ domain-containing protein [Mucidula mucida]
MSSDHYSTLSVPRNATKGQIKSSFYTLSREHHPDVSNSPQSAEVFRRASEAYSVLSDDRKRRVYDRSLPVGTSKSHAAAAAAGVKFKDRKKPGATHAWAKTYPTAHGEYMHPHPKDRFSSSSSSSGHAYSSRSTFTYKYPRSPYGDPLPNSHAWQTHPNATRSTSHRHDAHAQAQRMAIANISPLWRAIKLVGGVAILCTVLGLGRSRVGDTNGD